MAFLSHWLSVHFLFSKNNKISQWYITVSNITGIKLAGSRVTTEVYIDLGLRPEVAPYCTVRLGLAYRAVLLLL